jgi:hypothetical protein
MVIHDVPWVFKSLAVSTGTAGLMGNVSLILIGSYINWILEMTYSIGTLSVLYFFDVWSWHPPIVPYFTLDCAMYSK